MLAIRICMISTTVIASLAALTLSKDKSFKHFLGTWAGFQLIGIGIDFLMITILA